MPLDYMRLSKTAKHFVRRLDDCFGHRLESKDYKCLATALEERARLSRSKISYRSYSPYPRILQEVFGGKLEHNKSKGWDRWVLKGKDVEALAEILQPHIVWRGHDFWYVWHDQGKGWEDPARIFTPIRNIIVSHATRRAILRKRHR